MTLQQMQFGQSNNSRAPPHSVAPFCRRGETCCGLPAMVMRISDQKGPRVHAVFLLFWLGLTNVAILGAKK